MPVLILKNTSSEGPGTLGDFLHEPSAACRIVELGREPLPDAEGFDTLVMLGGPMSVNDEKEYPYLTDEIRLAERFMTTGRKVFGICLGSQIMAKALGAKVYPGPFKELGWFDIGLSGAGLGDPHMRALAMRPGLSSFEERFSVFHWHGETFDIPAGAELLAGSALYPHQAFRYGERAYAFQFHIEVTKEMIFDWMTGEDVDQAKIRQETERCYAPFSIRAGNFYRSFFAPDRTPARTQG